METRSKILDALKGEKEPFRVPEGYFDSLDLTLQKVIDTKEEEVTAKHVSLASRLKPWMGIAASVAVLFTTVMVTSNNAKTNAEQAKNDLPEEINGIQTKVLLTHLEEESIMDYLLTEE